MTFARQNVFCGYTEQCKNAARITIVVHTSSLYRLECHWDSTTVYVDPLDIGVLEDDKRQNISRVPKWNYFDSSSTHSPTNGIGLMLNWKMANETMSFRVYCRLMPVMEEFVWMPKIMSNGTLIVPYNRGNTPCLFSSQDIINLILPNSSSSVRVYGRKQVECVRMFIDNCVPIGGFSWVCCNIFRVFQW